MSTIEPPPTGSATGGVGINGIAASQGFDISQVQALAATYGSSGGGNRQVFFGPWQGSREYPGATWQPPSIGPDYRSQVPAAAQAYGLAKPPDEMFQPSPDYYSQVPQVSGTGNTAGYNTADPSKMWLTVDNANSYMTDLLASNPEEFYRIGDVLFDLGWFKNQTGYDQQDVLTKWAEIANIAANYSGKNGPGGSDDGKVPLTMNQIMYLYSPRLAGGIHSDIAGSASGADRLLPSHNVRTDTTIYSDSEAKGAFRDLAQRELGRDLNQRDLVRLTALLQGAQAGAPRTTITDTTPISETESRTTSKVRGGLDAQTFITDRLREDPNYAEHQAAAVYGPALMAALGATV